MRIVRCGTSSYARVTAAAGHGCTAKVQWPNGQLLSHRASFASGFDLCHSAVSGDPVTLFTARQGLRVEVQAAGSSRRYSGVLSRPIRMCDNGNVLWEVLKEGGSKGKSRRSIKGKSKGRRKRNSKGSEVEVEVGVADCDPPMWVSRGQVSAQVTYALGAELK